jgi:hypothetical protein
MPVLVSIAIVPTCSGRPFRAVYILWLWLGSGDIDLSHCALIGGGVENAARRERTVEPIAE